MRWEARRSVPLRTQRTKVAARRRAAAPLRARRLAASSAVSRASSARCRRCSSRTLSVCSRSTCSGESRRHAGRQRRTACAAQLSTADEAPREFESLSPPHLVRADAQLEARLPLGSRRRQRRRRRRRGELRGRHITRVARVRTAVRGAVRALERAAVTRTLPCSTACGHDADGAALLRVRVRVRWRRRRRVQHRVRGDTDGLAGLRRVRQRRVQLPVLGARSKGRGGRARGGVHAATGSTRRHQSEARVRRGGHGATEAHASAAVAAIRRLRPAEGRGGRVMIRQRR